MELNAWLRKKWYILLICIVIACLITGALISSPFAAPLGVVLGYFLTLLIYKRQNPDKAN